MSDTNSVDLSSVKLRANLLAYRWEMINKERISIRNQPEEIFRLLHGSVEAEDAGLRNKAAAVIEAADKELLAKFKNHKQYRIRIPKRLADQNILKAVTIENEMDILSKASGNNPGSATRVTKARVQKYKPKFLGF